MYFIHRLFRRVFPQSDCRVVITGLGVVSPIGIGKEEFWRSLLNHKSGIDFITRFDASSFPSRIAAEVRNFDPATFLTKKQIAAYSRSTQFAYVAAVMVPLMMANSRGAPPNRIGWARER